MVLLFSLSASADNESTLLIIGDSLSSGYGVPLDESWAKKLSEKLVVYNIHVTNASVSGETTSVGLAKLQSLLTQYKPKMVLLALGSNDGLRATQISLMRDNIEEMIRLSFNSGAKVALVGLKLPVNYGDYATYFANSFVQTAKANPEVIYIPFFLEEFSDDYSYFQEDLLHPNAKAQDIILETIYKHIKPHLIKN
ncbi:MAG: arylesterase [Francisellaceae bacterium]|nr:arylesterase [Francisellaceae bacterium]